MIGRALLPVAFVSSLLFACGGSGTESKTAGGASESGSSWESGDSSEGPSEPQGPDCSDGTCFACGDGFCPTGAYCDQDAQGGSACAWLTECAGNPSCGCVTGVLGSSCSCEENGGPVVSCQ